MGQYCRECDLYTEELNGACSVCGTKYDIGKDGLPNYPAERVAHGERANGPIIKAPSQYKGLQIFAILVIIVVMFSAIFAFGGNKESEIDSEATTTHVRPSYMSIYMYNECDDYTIHVMVWVDDRLACNDYIETGFLDSPGWIQPKAVDSKITVQFCIAEYGLWSEKKAVPNTYDNGDRVSLYFYPDYEMKYDATRWS